MQLLPVGYGNFLAPPRVLAILSPDSAPVRRSVSDARKQGRLLDATAGHKTRAVVYLDAGQVLLAALSPESLAGRFARLHGGGRPGLALEPPGEVEIEEEEPS